MVLFTLTLTSCRCVRSILFKMSQRVYPHLLGIMRMQVHFLSCHSTAHIPQAILDE